MAIDNDMKILLGASLDTSESSIKSLRNDIKTLKLALKEDKLDLNVRIDSNGDTVKNLKKDISTLQEKIAEKKIALGYKLDLSSENKSEVNKQIDKLNKQKNVNALKLKVEINMDKDTISRLNKQIDGLAKKLNGISISPNVGSNIDSKANSNANTQKGNNPDLDSYSDTYDDVTENIENQNRLLKETEKDMNGIISKTKEYQTGLTEVTKVATTIGKDGNEKLKSVQQINNYQTTSNNLYKRQADIEKEILKWKELKKNATTEEMASINQAITSLETEKQANDDILSVEILQNDQLDKKLQKQRDMSEIISNQKEALREMKLGDDTGYQDDSLFGNQEAIESWAKSVHGSGVAISNYKTKIQSLNNQQSQFTVATKSSKGMVTEYTYAVDKATGKVFKMSERVREAGRRTIDLANDFKIAMNRILEWNVAMSLIYGSINKFKEGVEFISTLDNELTQVAMVTGQTREEVSKLTQEYINMAKATSKTVTEIANVNTELTRQGLGKIESMERLETVLKLSSVASTDVTQTLSIITSSVNALGESAEHTADVLIKAGDISASSVDSIGTAMTKVASSAKSNGMAIEELSSIISTLIDVTQEAPETLGNSLKSMMARFSKLNELGELNEDLNDVNTAFSTVGIAFKDAEGQIRPFYELCQDMAGVWGDLDQNTKAYVATMSAGTMQGNRFIALMDNWNRVSNITTELYADSDGRMDKSYEVWLDSVEAKTNDLKIAWEELWTKLINSDDIKSFFVALTTTVNALSLAFDKLDVTGVAVSVTMFAMMAKTGGLKSIMTELKTSTGLVSATLSVFRGMITRTTKAESDLVVTENLLALAGKKLGISLVLSEVGMMAYGKAVIWATAKQVAMMAVTGVATAGMSILVGLIASSVVGAFMSLGDSIDDTTESTEELMKASQDSIAEYNKNTASLNKVKKAYTEYQERIESGSEALKLNAEEQEEYNSIVEQISQIFPEIIQGYDEQGNAIVRYGTKIEELIAQEEALAKIEKQKLLASSDNMVNEVKKEIENIEQKEKIYKAMVMTGKNEEDTTRHINMLPDDMVEEEFEKKAKRIQELREIISNPLTTEKQSSKASEELEELEKRYSSFIAKSSLLNVQIDEQKKKLQDIAQIKIDYAFEDIDVDNAVKGVGQDFVIDIFSKAFDEDIETSQVKVDEAINAFASIYGKMEDIMDDDTPTSISDNVDALDGLRQELVNLGIPTEEATNLIYNMAEAMIQATGSGDALALSVSQLSSKFKEDYSEINKLQGYMKTLASGEQLAVENMVDLIDSNEALAKYVADTGDVYLENGEKVRQVLEAKYSELQNDLSIQKDIKNATKKRLEQEKQEIQETLTALRKKYTEESTVIQDQIKKLKDKETAISNCDTEYAKLAITASAYKSVLEEDYTQEGLDALSSGFENATEKISAYKDMLKEVQKNGISGEMVKEVMQNHTELIDVLGDEGSMYNRLCQLIAQEEKVQKDSYRRMQNYSKTFLNSVLKGNVDLYNKLTSMYGSEVSNFKNMYDVKTRIINDFNKKYSASLSENLANASVFEISSQKAQSEKALANLLANKPKDSALGSVLGNSFNPALKLWENQVEKTKEEIATLGTLMQSQSASDNYTEMKMDDINFEGVNVSDNTDSKNTTEKTKTKIELIKLETDAYLKLTKAMSELERQQNNNQKILEYADGKDRIELLTKEIDMLTKKQKITENLAKEYRSELATLQTSLSKKIGLGDGANGINNYNAYMKTQETSINKLINQINASNDDDVVKALTEKKDALKDAVDKFSEDFQRYLEIKMETIPDLSDEWWELMYEKFENTLSIMETDLDKFEKQISKISDSMEFILQGKHNNNDTLKEEYELMLNIADIYQNEIKNIQDKITSNNTMVEKYEKLINSISDKQSDTYLMTSKYLILARNEQDKLAEALSSALTQYSSQLNSQIQKHVEMLDSMKEKAIETFQEMRKELDEFSTKDFQLELDTIIDSLDVIDGIFMSNPQYLLSTSGARDEISNLDSDITSMNNKINSFKEISDRISKSEIKDGQSANNQKEDLLELIEEQIAYENELKEIYTAISEQLGEQTLEYKKIEDALQNQIDAKQDELDALQEQFETESKITSMMEKRLALLKAMDDTRYTYITGQGESVFTYDVSNVNGLKQDIGQAQREADKDKMLEDLKTEIDAMNENLEKTKEIHEQQLAILELQEENVNELLSILSDSLDNNLGDNMDKIYENLTDIYITDLQESLDTQTDILSSLYSLIDKRVPISATNITQAIDSGSNWATTKTTHTVGKNESSLEDIASAYNTTVSKLLKLNTGLSADTILKYGQKLNVPAFDTGGYTGEFGSEGRIGILHEKELILDKQDTSNVLKAVDIAKVIASRFESIQNNQMNDVDKKDSVSEQNQIIQNMNIYGVKDVNSFSNEMQKLLRNGMARLS